MTRGNCSVVVASTPPKMISGGFQQVLGRYKLQIKCESPGVSNSCGVGGERVRNNSKGITIIE